MNWEELLAALATILLTVLARLVDRYLPPVQTQADYPAETEVSPPRRL